MERTGFSLGMANLSRSSAFDAEKLPADSRVVGLNEEKPGDWQSCRIGSCQRHQDCMYRPCRSLRIPTGMVGEGR